MRYALLALALMGCGSLQQPGDTTPDVASAPLIKETLDHVRRNVKLAARLVDVVCVAQGASSKPCRILESSLTQVVRALADADRVIDSYAATGLGIDTVWTAVDVLLAAIAAMDDSTALARGMVADGNLRARATTFAPCPGFDSWPPAETQDAPAVPAPKATSGGKQAPAQAPQ